MNKAATYDIYLSVYSSGYYRCVSLKGPINIKAPCGISQIIIMLLAILIHALAKHYGKEIQGFYMKNRTNKLSCVERTALKGRSRWALCAILLLLLIHTHTNTQHNFLFTVTETKECFEVFY